jgi:hypothetical protein
MARALIEEKVAQIVSGKAVPQRIVLATVNLAIEHTPTPSN